MALGYRTYGALPRLRTYADALRRYEETKPIARDANEPRPLGRRDQAWYTIWQYDGRVYVGYGRDEIKDRQPLISFAPTGVISLHTNGYSSASDNERINKILGLRCETFQFKRWVRCAQGWLPVTGAPQTERKDRTIDDYPSLDFVRYQNDQLFALNPVLPVRHTINKVATRRIMEQYAPFLEYAEGIDKLDDKGCFAPSNDAVVDAGFADGKVPHITGAWRFSREGFKAEIQANRQELLALARSDDPEDRYRALVWLKRGQGVYYSYQPAKSRDLLLLTIRYGHRDELFDTEIITDGSKKWDRYANYFA